ncbi:MAG: hypothetical protein Faunusvirus20_5 [Faunusvirus sp.]|uniref:Uncharacterized protein n=1 Tax=Faunusvirus sp. TaxID=2487766 RepID=A0A3G4ZX96_9VIRU|nr:MAG: hypothetical protein Faunusvirus20_5 [Faunusvirus sp.]
MIIYRFIVKYLDDRRPTVEHELSSAIVCLRTVEYNCRNTTVIYQLVMTTDGPIAALRSLHFIY